MVMGFRERRLGCRLYVDRQSDANILKKLDRMLVDGSFPNQTELIKRGIELAYEEVYGEAEEVKASHRQEIDVKKLAEEVDAKADVGGVGVSVAATLASHSAINISISGFNALATSSANFFTSISCLWDALTSSASPYTSS